MNFNNVNLVKLGNDSEIEFIKWNGIFIYQDNAIPLYVPYKFRDNKEITEVTTMVSRAHDNLSHMFSGCTYLESINTLDWRSTKNVTTMVKMFYNCKYLLSLDLSKFNTGKVISMYEMFHYCYRLASLEGLKNWNTSKVPNMSYMFADCRELTTLDLSNWDLSSVTDMSYMFYNCEKLEKVNLSNWNMDTGNEIKMSQMFGNCASLHELRLDNCNTYTIQRILTNGFLPLSYVTNPTGKTRLIYCQEANATGLTAPDGWKFVDIKPYEVGDYAYDTEITEITTYIDNTHTDLSGMFQGCTALTTVNTTEWDTSNVTTMQTMFYGCESLVSLDLSNFDTGNVTNMGAMFYQCYELQSLDLSNFDMSNVDLVANMLGSCTKLHLLILNNCSNDTIRKIVTSYNFPSGSPIGTNASIRILYCKEENADGIEELLPSGWEIVYVD